MLSSITISEDLAQRICDEINKDQLRASELRETQKKTLRSKYETLERRKDAMYEDRLDGRITVAKYDKLADKITQEMREIDDELVRLESTFEDSGTTVSNLLKLAVSVNEIFKSSKPAVKTKF